MIDTISFAKHSPFKATHAPSDSAYKLHNTTVDLLKFQLHQQRRSVITDAKASRAAPRSLFPQSQSLMSPHIEYISNRLDHGDVFVHLQPAHNSTCSNDDDLSLTSSPAQTDLASHDQMLPIDSFIELNSVSLIPLNVTILVEKAMLAASKVSRNAILSLVSLRNLEAEIALKSDEHSRLLQEISRSQEFVRYLTSDNNPHIQQLGSSLLVKILSLILRQQSRLLEISLELTSSTAKLNNHNMACLALGNFVDVKVSEMAHAKSGLGSDLSVSAISLPPSPVSSEKLSRSLALPSSSQVTSSIDTIFSHIAQIAVQRGVSLPSPPTTGSDSLIDGDLPLRTAWLLQCIDTVLGSSREQIAQPNCQRDSQLLMGETPEGDRSQSESSNMSIQDYKTALSDLRFTHQYLVKEYEHLRETSALTLQECRKRSARLERQVSQLRSLLNNGNGASPYNLPNSSASTLISPLKIDYDSLKSKEQEIARLRREIDARRVEKLGEGPPVTDQQPRNPQALIPPPVLAKDHDLGDSLTTFPINGFSGLPKSLNETSASILRKEFKKIVNDIHERYEVELEQERTRRRSLENAISLLKSG